MESIYPTEKYSLGWMVDFTHGKPYKFFTNIVEDKIVFSETPTLRKPTKTRLFWIKYYYQLKIMGKLLVI